MMRFFVDRNSLTVPVGCVVFQIFLRPIPSDVSLSERLVTDGMSFTINASVNPYKSYGVSNDQQNDYRCNL